MLALAATPGRLPSATATRLARGSPPAELLRPDSPDPAAVAARLHELGIRFLLPGDPEWPLLSSPPDPPCAWLFAAGRPLPEPEMSVAVVGGRRASQLRRSVAASLAAALVRAGRAVLSGGAAGVDTAAHRGALEAAGATVAVLGCGLDVAYPRVNARLLAQLRDGDGTLVGEHPPGAPPRPANFVPRNRLIASLAAAVVVVEAGVRSGSLATARAAGSRGAGRVLVVPGAPWDPGAAGCNGLIRDGAVLVRGVDDVLAELGERAPPGASRVPVPLGREARRVLPHLGDGLPVPPARLAVLTGLEPVALARALLELELAGLAGRSVAGVQALAWPGEPAARYGTGSVRSSAGMPDG
jgi:DNA processing protein